MINDTVRSLFCMLCYESEKDIGVGVGVGVGVGGVIDLTGNRNESRNGNENENGNKGLRRSMSTGSSNNRNNNDNNSNHNDNRNNDNNDDSYNDNHSNKNTKNILDKEVDAVSQIILSVINSMCTYMRSTCKTVSTVQELLSQCNLIDIISFMRGRLIESELISVHKSILGTICILL